MDRKNMHETRRRRGGRGRGSQGGPQQFSPSLLSRLLLGRSLTRQLWLRSPFALLVAVFGCVSSPHPAQAQTHIQVEIQSIPAQQQVTLEELELELSPYGQWIYVAGLGRVWQPWEWEVGSGFQPYSTGGEWVLTHHGWVFQSRWSWGWAPFHYGRWTRHASFGWVWVPDTVWGPAWVDWRVGGGYVGWAPLPPRSMRVESYGGSWIFIKNSYFGQSHWHHHAIYGPRGRSVWSRTQPYRHPVRQGRVYWYEGPSRQHVHYPKVRELPARPSRLVRPAQPSPSPARPQSPTGVRPSTPAPQRVTPSPANRPTPSPINRPSPSPVNRPSPVPTRPSPSPANRASPSEQKRPSPARPTPQRTAPAPSRQAPARPSPMRPAPARPSQRSLSPSRPSLSSPSNFGNSSSLGSSLNKRVVRPSSTSSKANRPSPARPSNLHSAPARPASKSNARPAAVRPENNGPRIRRPASR